MARRFIGIGLILSSGLEIVALLGGRCGKARAKGPCVRLGDDPFIGSGVGNRILRICFERPIRQSLGGHEHTNPGLGR